MRKFLKIFAYDFKITIRQREAMFWLLIFPVLIMIILGFVFGSAGDVKLKVGIVDLDGSPVSRAIVEAFEGIDAIVTEVGSEDEERAAIRDGDRNGIIIISEGFGEQVTSGLQGELTIIINRSEITTAQITSSTLRGIIDEIGQRMSGAPEIIEVNEEEAQDVKDFEYIDFMVPGIIAITLMFGGLMGYNLEIASYREKGILRRIKVSPLSLPTFLAGGIFNVLVFTLVQTVLLLLVGTLVFNLSINANYLYLAVLVLIGALSFLALGFLIASLTKNMRSASLAANAVSMPMMFLSGVFFSVDWVPAPLKIIAQCLPLYYLGDGLREVMTNSAGLLDIWLDLVVLVGMGLIAFIASVRFFRWE
ncbi:MAG: ABC transporter permease [Actinomycetota bacterium]|nr:ABC transporter permease [Actinomycetota bacterium]MDD5667857.1 ABC transporter permease [Actinomycetota bacterium]